MEELLQHYKPLLRKNLLLIILFGLALMLLIYGLIQLFLPKSSESIIFDSEQSSNSSPSAGVKNDTSYIVIDVSGAVVNPGVYHIEKDGRLQEALIQAGGMAENADREYVSKHINLAQKMQDGSKVYIPFVGETVSNPQSVLGAQSSQESLININTASLSELDTLSGVGSVTAGKIIQNRPYQTIEELVSKKVLGKSVFEKIKDKITVN